MGNSMYFEHDNIAPKSVMLDLFVLMIQSLPIYDYVLPFNKIQYPKIAQKLLYKRSHTIILKCFISGGGFFLL